jgi:hypothetical protein
MPHWGIQIEALRPGIIEPIELGIASIRIAPMNAPMGNWQSAMNSRRR